MALFLTALCRRSKHAKQIVLYLAAMGNALRRMTHTHRAAKVGDLLRIAVEFLKSFRNPSADDPHTRRKMKTRSIAELTELLAYEEMDEPAAAELSGTRQRAHRVMHHVIPTNPFRATVRHLSKVVPRTPSPSTVQHEADAQSLVSTISNRWEADVADALNAPDAVVLSAEKDSPT